MTIREDEQKLFNTMQLVIRELYSCIQREVREAEADKMEDLRLNLLENSQYSS